MVRPMLLYNMKATGEILGLNAACLLGQVREGRASYTLTISSYKPTKDSFKVFPLWLLTQWFSSSFAFGCQVVTKHSAKNENLLANWRIFLCRPFKFFKTTSNCSNNRLTQFDQDPMWYFAKLKKPDGEEMVWWLYRARHPPLISLSSKWLRAVPGPDVWNHSSVDFICDSTCVTVAGRLHPITLENHAGSCKKKKFTHFSLSVCAYKVCDEVYTFTIALHDLIILLCFPFALIHTA